MNHYDGESYAGSPRLLHCDLGSENSMHNLSCEEVIVMAGLDWGAFDMESPYLIK